jgi:exopolysaccharide biosynthesis polyprenyl glycosylphosphotransferase
MPDEDSPKRQGTEFWKSRWLTVLLMAFDLAGFSAVWWLAYELRVWLGTWATGPINDFAPYAAVFPLVVALGMANAVVFGLYMHRRRVSSIARWGILIRAGYHYLLCLMVVGYFWKELDLGRSVIVLAGLLGFLHLYISRTLFRSLKESALAEGKGRVRAIVLGSGALAVEVNRSLDEHRDIGYDVVGYVRYDGDEVAPELAGLACLGTSDQLPSILHTKQVEEIFLAVPHLTPDEQLNLINVAEFPGLRIHLVSDLFGVLTREGNVNEIGSFPVVTLRDGYVPWHQALAKRTFDLAASIVGIALWLVLFHWWIALKIRLDSPGPIFFSQDRVGRGGSRFRIWKYRTMRTDAAAYAVAPTLESDPRITRFGKWLRHTSLDELPQLWNVFIGEMSIVGPRPEMPFIVENYEAWQRRRLDVKPGVTGLWQVIGRKNLPLHLNMEYDFYYIKNQSLLLDIEILIRTVPAVIKGRGAF